ncbi:MAG: PIN domain-containing protein [Fimbriimonadaceae bacterium]|nr:PIN domain-containing protein [Fimbriimonadaceae bacterium]
MDTWAWLALLVKDDPHHARAADLMHRMRRAGHPLVTSNFVLAEALTRLRYDISHAAAMTLHSVVEQMVASSRLEVVIIDRALWQSATEWFRRFSDQRFSFVDCTSFAVMRTRGMQDALTVDQHFATAGFTALATT